jgi:hypothetical protein
MTTHDLLQQMQLGIIDCGALLAKADKQRELIDLLRAIAEAARALEFELSEPAK